MQHTGESEIANYILREYATMLPPEVSDDGFGGEITTFSLSKKIPIFIRIGLALPLMPIRTAPLPACRAPSPEQQVATTDVVRVVREGLH